MIRSDLCLQLAETQFRMPLVEVRPEAPGILKEKRVTQPPMCPSIQSTSPYFMENSNAEKYFMQGEATLPPDVLSVRDRSRRQLRNMYCP
jgi:hypothetical protein